jgi:hypothetical protein
MANYCRLRKKQIGATTRVAPTTYLFVGATLVVAPLWLPACGCALVVARLWLPACGCPLVVARLWLPACGCALVLARLWLPPCACPLAKIPVYLCFRTDLCYLNQGLSDYLITLSKRKLYSVSTLKYLPAAIAAPIIPA